MVNSSDAFSALGILLAQRTAQNVCVMPSTYTAPNPLHQVTQVIAFQRYTAKTKALCVCLGTVTQQVLKNHWLCWAGHTWVLLPACVSLAWGCLPPRPCNFPWAEPEAKAMLPFLTLVHRSSVGQGQSWSCLPSGGIVGGPGSRIVNVNEASSQTSSFF